MLEMHELKIYKRYEPAIGATQGNGGPRTTIPRVATRPHFSGNPPGTPEENKAVTTATFSGALPKFVVNKRRLATGHFVARHVETGLPVSITNRAVCGWLQLGITLASLLSVLSVCKTIEISAA